MSRIEAAVLIDRLSGVMHDLLDLRWTEAAPQHIVTAASDHLTAIEEAVRELKRLHGIGHE